MKTILKSNWTKLLFIIVLLIIIAMPSKKTAEVYGECIFTLDGIDWVCTAAGQGQDSGGGDLDFSDCFFSFASGECSGHGSVVVTDVITLHAQTDGNDICSRNVYCVPTNINLDNVDTIDFLIDGTVQIQGNCNHGGASITRFGLWNGLTYSGNPMYDSITVGDAIADYFVSEWLTYDLTQSRPFQALFSTVTSIQDGTCHSRGDGVLEDMIFNCEEGYAYNGEGACVSGPSYLEFLYYINQYLQGAISFEDFAENANRYIQ